MVGERGVPVRHGGPRSVERLAMQRPIVGSGGGARQNHVAKRALHGVTGDRRCEMGAIANRARRVRPWKPCYVRACSRPKLSAIVRALSPIVLLPRLLRRGQPPATAALIRAGMRPLIGGAALADSPESRMIVGCRARARPPAALESRARSLGRDCTGCAVLGWPRWRRQVHSCRLRP
jgi:hypothetical protein